MNILIIMPWIKQGGAEMIAVQTAFQLQKLGYRVRLAAVWVDFSQMEQWEKITRQVNYVTVGNAGKFLAKSKWLTYFVSPFFLLCLILKNVGWSDILFPHSLPGYWIASIVGKIFGKKTVWLCNEPPKKRELKKVGLADFLMWQLADSILDRWFVWQIDIVIVYSMAIKKEVTSRYNKEARLIRLGIDFDFFSKVDKKQGLKLEKKYNLKHKFVLLMVGKLHPQKNQLLGIKVLSNVLGQIPEAVLVLVGEGEDKKELKAQSEKLKVGDRVIFTGFCPPEIVRAWYEVADLALCPSVTQTAMVNQSWGFIPFEALCQEKLSIVSQNSGAAEVISKQKIGFVCPVKTKPFTDQVIDFYQNKKKYQPMTKRGRKWVRDNLSWEEFGKEVRKIVIRNT